MANVSGLTDFVIGCIIRVHQALGPGFVEKIYRRALVIELCKQSLFVETEKRVTIYYDGQQVGTHVLDILVDHRLIIELKTIDALSKAHYAQVRSYLKAANLDVALLINFSSPRADIRRVHPHIPGIPTISLDEA